MIVSNDIRTKLWNDGMWLAVAVPSISAELRPAMELVQNSDDVTPFQVKEMLKGVLTVLVKYDNQLGEEHKSKLVRLFNHIAKEYSAPFSIDWSGDEKTCMIGQSKHPYNAIVEYFGVSE